MEMTSSTDVSPTITPCGTPLSGAPKYGTVIPNRIFVGGIAANTTEQELKLFFSAYGAVKDAKIIADRAGVSKGYGFITFENQEVADRILKKEVSVESDNLVFRDRKLNIGPAIRKQQVLPRAFESPTVSPGAVMYTNGVPYTYQNGMAVFASPESGYTVPQAQPQTALMMPQTPPVYVQPQYATYQVPVSYGLQASLQTSPQWTTAAAANATAAAASHWRYMTQSPTTALTATANPYLVAMQPADLMYAQVPTQAYQPTEFTDAALLEGAAGVEGSILPMGQNLQPGHKAAGCATETHSTSSSTANGPSVMGDAASMPAGLTAANIETVHMTKASVNSNPVAVLSNQVPVINTTSMSCIVTSNCVPVTTCNPASTILASSSAKQMSSVCSVSVAPYRVPLNSVARRAYTSPTYLVRNGHKVQCVMMPTKPLPSPMTLMARPPESLTPPTGAQL